MTTRTASREDRVAALVEELHDGVSLLTTTEGWHSFLATAVRFHRYSFWNTVAILCQRPDATRIAGYQTWRRLGRQVRRGERGIRILAPCTYRVRDEETDDDPGRLVLRGWRVATVFDLVQTDGQPLPEPPVTMLDGDAPAGLRDQLAALIRSDGYEFTVAPLPTGTPAGALGVTDHATRHVTVRADLPDAQQAKTTAHELAHVRLHRGTTDRPTAEIEAESVAYVVCGAVGLATDAYSFGYLATWASGDTDAIRATGERVITSARAVLDGLGVDHFPPRAED
jgi:antirestriction protein ArdC